MTTNTTTRTGKLKTGPLTIKSIEFQNYPAMSVREYFADRLGSFATNNIFMAGEDMWDKTQCASFLGDQCMRVIDRTREFLKSFDAIDHVRRPILLGATRQIDILIYG